MIRKQIGWLAVLVPAFCLFAGSALGQAPATKASNSDTVLCKDGTTSKKGKGACSHHGGVATSTTPSGSAGTEKGTGGSAAQPQSTQKPAGTPSPNAKTEPSTGSAASRGTAPSSGASTATPPAGKASKPTARCKDGTLSYSAQHEGGCSHHGGVDQWLDKK